MAIDPRIALGVQPVNLTDILRDAEAYQAARQDRAVKQQLMERQAAEAQRASDYRAALSEYITAGNEPPPAQPAPAAPASTEGEGGPVSLTSLVPGAFTTPASQPAPPSARESAFARMAATDPAAAIEARKAQFEHMEGQLDMISRLAGSAVDQTSYTNARNRAAALGLDVSSLPEQFSPAIVSQVLNEALSAKERLAAMRADRRLTWDIEDDEIDNARADENLDSLTAYREGSLSNVRRGQDLRSSDTRRGQDLTDRRGRRGQDIASGDRRRGQDITDKRNRDKPTSPAGVVAPILAKEASGQPLTAGEQKVLDRFYKRRGGRGARAAAPPPPGATTAAVRIRPNEPVSQLADGRLAVVRDGKWVPAVR